jgi:hypothetical protein
MDGERLARASLALDAAYCTTIGLLALALRTRLSGLLGLPAAVIAAAGVAAIGWAGLVIGQALRTDWHRGTAETATANMGVSIALAVASAFHPGRGARLLLSFVSLDVASFGVAQLIALARRATSSG